ncbi:hypothetical protein WJX73_003856 [Symbiochloris irregularis]|uniref:Uncharacterized protein n=1 Tax=Symbiochloris irregularis TaxID=706552 RepID=A0AAW1NPU0_9CHLO
MSQISKLSAERGYVVSKNARRPPLPTKNDSLAVGERPSLRTPQGSGLKDAGATASVERSSTADVQSLERELILLKKQQAATMQKKVQLRTEMERLRFFKALQTKELLSGKADKACRKDGQLIEREIENKPKRKTWAGELLDLSPGLAHSLNARHL